MRKLLATGFLLVVAAAPAAAQDYKPVDVYFGFGWAFPTTDLKNSFGKKRTELASKAITGELSAQQALDLLQQDMDTQIKLFEQTKALP